MKKTGKTAIVVSVLLTGACVVPFLYIFLLSVKDTDGTVTFLNFYKVLNFTYFYFLVYHIEFYNSSIVKNKVYK